MGVMGDLYPRGGQKPQIYPTNLTHLTPAMGWKGRWWIVGVGSVGLFGDFGEGKN